jgi:uncharacterized membrane protein
MYMYRTFNSIYNNYIYKYMYVHLIMYHASTISSLSSCCTPSGGALHAEFATLAGDIPSFPGNRIVERITQNVFFELTYIIIQITFRKILGLQTLEIPK